MVTEEYILIVGCTDRLVVTDDPSLVTHDIRVITEDYVGAYQFVPPTNNLTYCPVIKNEVIDITVNGVPSETAVTPTAGCT